MKQMREESRKSRMPITEMVTVEKEEIVEESSLWLKLLGQTLENCVMPKLQCLNIGGNSFETTDGIQLRQIMQRPMPNRDVYVIV